MNKLFQPIFGLLLLFILSGCSTLQHFIVCNSSNSGVIVRYQLTGTGSGIFSDKATVYSLNSSNEIDWNTPTIPQDHDTSSTGVWIRMPVKSALVFGGLQNDHYTDYKQDFKNGDTFNLEVIRVFANNIETIVYPLNFDFYFKKKNGNIRMDIN